ncbi:hypothetical protein EMPG_11900 [Blastomyces silverae]|uniref:Aminoglycoside phosphotransferase domain-containing protein n=1 Tax=Blastomyces silverae TaxID=2060906 RepID=A0A0H1BNM6_9EURO|nr:hypothetical protein EMPG_11900 [Blastomyces silverae]
MTINEIHFTHGDFSPRNIMVENGEVKAVLDGDRAGWYPENWNQNRILSENPGIRYNYPYLKHIIPFKYAQEIVAMGLSFAHFRRRVGSVFCLGFRIFLNM